MKTKILTALTALASITASCFALAASEDTSSTKSSSSFYDNDYFKDTYFSLGYGKSLPYSKLSGLSLDQNGTEFYTKKRSKNSDVFKASIGKKFDDVRVEFEFLYSKKHKFNFSNSIPSEDVTLFHSLHTSHHTYFVNAFYDFKGLHDSIRPYVGLGLGVSRNKVSAGSVLRYISSVGITAPFQNSSKKSSTSFAWNTSLGLIVDVNEHFFLDFSYKYLDLGKAKGMHLNDIDNDPTTSNNIKGRFRNNLFLLGAGFKF